MLNHALITPKWKIDGQVLEINKSTEAVVLINKCTIWHETGWSHRIVLSMGERLLGATWAGILGPYLYWPWAVLMEGVEVGAQSVNCTLLLDEWVMIALPRCWLAGAITIIA